MLGFYLKDKGFEMGLNSFLSSLRENNSGIRLSVIVSVRERVGSARIFSRRDQQDFIKFQNQLIEAKKDFPNNINIFGFLSIEEMQSVISESDYLLMPYLNISNSGVAVTAKAHGIPVIASDLVPLVEAFGEIGIYFKAESSSDLTSRINRVASNPNWRIERDQRADKLVGIATLETAVKIAASISDTECS
jgi:glycosyltransferase involved in cell wall biosynthesis